MTCEIPLTKGLVALVDDADAPAVLNHKWWAEGTPKAAYARARINGSQIMLHRFLIGQTPGFWVDHINGDSLDNRRANLRVCTPQENARNRVTVSRQTGFKGVYPQTVNSYFSAIITVAGKSRRIGSFRTAEEAAHAYDQAARDEFGAFAVLNFLGGTGSEDIRDRPDGRRGSRRGRAGTTD